MIISIKYSELSSIIRLKTGHDIKFTFKGKDTITASYKASMEIPVIKKMVSKEVDVDLQILELKDNKVVIRADAGLVGNFAINVLQNILLAYIPMTYYPGAEDGRTFLLNLNDIEQLKPILSQLSINSLNIGSEDIQVNTIIRI